MASLSPPRPKIRPIAPRSGSSYDSNSSSSTAKRRLKDGGSFERKVPAASAVVPLPEQPPRNRKRGRSELYNDTDDEGTLNTKTIKSSENGGSFSQSLTGSFRQEDDDDDVDDVMKDSVFSDVNYRRNCGSTTEGSQPQQDELDNRGGKRRLLDVVGSVVGAVWEFCKSQAPDLSSLGFNPTSRFATPSGPEYFDTPYNMPPEMFQQDDHLQRTMPGGLPDYDMFDRAAASYAPASTAMATPQSPGASSGNLRKHRPPALNSIGSPTSMKPTERGMSGSWVLVNDKASSSAVGSSPVLKASSASTRQNQGIRPSTPMYTTSFPVMVKRNGMYSRTVPRKARPFSRPMMPFGGANKFNPVADEIGSPGGLRASSASAPSSPVRASTAKSSGASEASFRGNSKRALLDNVFAADFVPNLPGGELRNTPSLRKNPEMDADESIRKFNKRLKDMIREGREALGSTIEVYDCEDEWDDEVTQLGSKSKVKANATATVWR